MTSSFPQVLLFLFIGIAVIVLLTARFRVHAFFALFIACFVTGLGMQMQVNDIIVTMREGFGNIMRSLALIIVLGTTLGAILEHTGSTKVMANFILRKTGEKHTALAMSITGFIVGLPIFCDSGFIVLSGLNRSLIRKTGISASVLSVSLATGLYSVHCLIPPHPGAAAAAGVIGVDVGMLMLTGIMVAIPAMLVGYWWANFAGKKVLVDVEEEVLLPDVEEHLPSALKSFLPVVIPIVLIGVKSLLSVERSTSVPAKIFSILGDPVVALAVGVVFSLANIRHWQKDVIGKLLTEGAEKAGGILVIIGAGGAFGAVLSASHLGDNLKHVQSLNTIGMLFPFLITFVLKTAQGSSTVAIITAASIIQPILSSLQLDTEWGKLLCVLSMGAGSMMISHANDAYFWVISKFSGLDIKMMLRVYSVATILMGVTSIIIIYLLSLLLL